MTEQAGKGGDDLIRDTVGDDGAEVGQIGVDIQCKPVVAHPPTHPHPDRREFVVPGLDAGVPKVGRGLDPEARCGPQYHPFCLNFNHCERARLLYESISTTYLRSRCPLRRLGGGANW